MLDDLIDVVTTALRLAATCAGLGLLYVEALLALVGTWVERLEVM